MVPRLLMVYKYNKLVEKIISKKVLNSLILDSVSILAILMELQVALV